MHFAPLYPCEWFRRLHAGVWKAQIKFRKLSYEAEFLSFEVKNAFFQDSCALVDDTLSRWYWFKGQLYQVSPRRTFRLPYGPLSCNIHAVRADNTAISDPFPTHTSTSHPGVPPRVAIAHNLLHEQKYRFAGYLPVPGHPCLSQIVETGDIRKWVRQNRFWLTPFYYYLGGQNALKISRC